jgi:hypothetical protein
VIGALFDMEAEREGTDGSETVALGPHLTRSVRESITLLL